MKLIFDNKDITKYLLNFSLQYDLSSIYNTLNFSIPYKVVKEHKLTEGLKVSFESDKSKFEGIVIKYTDKNNDIASFEAVSKAWYLSVYEETYQVNASAKEAITSIIKDYDKSYRLIIASRDFSMEVKKIYYDMSLGQIIEDILEQVASKTSKEYFVIDDVDTIKVIDKGREVEVKVEEILSLGRSFDISKVKNQIKAISVNNNQVKSSIIMKDAMSIDRIGKIQKVHRLESESLVQGRKEAEELLKLHKKKKKAVGLDIIGNYSLKIGDIVKIKSDKYLLKKLKHSIKQGMHISILELEEWFG